MKWTETNIARALAMQFFNRKYLVVVPNCNWPGSECDLLCVTENLRIIDVEIKISRSDLRADAKKDKWWKRGEWRHEGGRYIQGDRHAAEWPRQVWKHYYALPAEIWTAELFDVLPSAASGVLLLREAEGLVSVECLRAAKPCKDAQPISAASAIDIARLASLRMWESYRAVDQLRRQTTWPAGIAQ